MRQILERLLSLRQGDRGGACHPHRGGHHHHPGQRVQPIAPDGGGGDRLRAGHRDLPIPNLLRVSIGKVVEPRGRGYEEDAVTLIEANIEDMNPEFYNHVNVMEKLFERGALDVFFTPIQMKKSRPATMPSALVRENELYRVLDAFFDETTTLGVRLYEVRRKKQAREMIYGREEAEG